MIEPRRGGGSTEDDATGPAVRRLDDWPGATLRDLGEAHGTPLYVLDLDRVRENYRRLSAAFGSETGGARTGGPGSEDAGTVGGGSIGTETDGVRSGGAGAVGASGDGTPGVDGVEVLYALKANALGPVLETLLDEGAGLECASAGEVARSFRAGAKGSQVHYTAVNPPAEDLEYVVERWADAPELTITAGATDTIDRLDAMGYDGRLCLRVNPGIGAGHHEKVKTGVDAKFGVPAERAADVLADAAARGFDVVGVHAHVGSGVSPDQLDAHRAFVARMGDVAREVEARVGPLEFVDVGGGFGVPYRPEDAPLDLAAVADATLDAVGQIDAALVVEPGRYLVADAGVLVTGVNTVKATPETTVVGVDAGMTTLARPAIYDAHHEIRCLATDAEERDVVETTVTGPICESSDVFCTDHELPAIERGEYLAIGNAGAYGYEMASQYNSRPRPASVVLDRGKSRLARARETIDDVLVAEARAGGSTPPGRDV